MKLRSSILLFTSALLLSSCSICIGQCKPETPDEEDPEGQDDTFPEEEKKYLVDQSVMSKFYSLDLFMENKFEALLNVTTVSQRDNSTETTTTSETKRNLFDYEKWEIISDTQHSFYVRHEEEKARCYSYYTDEWHYIGDYNFYWKNDLKRSRTLYLALDYYQLEYSIELHAYTYKNLNRLVDADNIKIQFENNIWKYLEFDWDEHYNYTYYRHHVRVDISRWGEVSLTEPTVE